MTVELDRVSGFLYLLLRDVIPAGALTDMVESLGTDPRVSVDDALIAALARQLRNRLLLTEEAEQVVREETVTLRRPGEGQGMRITTDTGRIGREIDQE